MSGAVRRVVVVLSVVGLWGVGMALLASPAVAGAVNTDTGLLEAGFYNVTPYPMTLVAAQTPGTTPQNPQPQNYWSTRPAATIPAGGISDYALNTNYAPSSGICIGDYLFGYDAYMTYRVDVLDGPPEYVTLAISQAKSHSLTGCFNFFPTGDHDPRFDVFITNAPPPPGYDPATSPGTPPAAEIANPQVTFAHNQPTLYDQYFQIAGDYTVDASTNLGAPFVNVLNTICGSNPSACSFTQKSPLTWGLGALRNQQTVLNCTVGGQSPPPSGGGGGEPPPAQDPNWFAVDYAAAQSASLSVGGGLTVGTEFNLFDTISGSISIKVEAEHEWQETKTFTRTAKVFIPSNNIATLGVVPVVGTVTGTLVVSNGSATFTATNFTETRDGVTRSALTPAFNVITRMRPLTPQEFQSKCVNPSSKAGSTKRLVAPDARPLARLVAGRGVARVGLGRTQAQVQQTLGQPSVKHFHLNPCQGLAPGCYAVAGVGGTWSYGRLSVVFGPDLRVSGLIYRGSRRGAKGVGVGSGMAAVRRAYPRVFCTSANAKRRHCTLQGNREGRAVNTVFVFIKTRTGKYTCKRVLIYALAGPGGVKQ